MPVNQWLAVLKMEKYRNPTAVKVIIIFIIIIFPAASLSPEFMFNMLGISNTEPFLHAFYNSCIIGVNALDSNIDKTREAGIVIMLSLLVIFLTLYLLYRIFNSIYSRYKISKNEN